VYQRIKHRYPQATGPLIVHRLDMSTSGLLVLAKNKEVHEHLQKQFLKRKVKKTYVALLDGCVVRTKGKIELPLRGDLNDRPRQMVCYEYGKNALTHFKVIESDTEKTRIEFEPITGRTHQLRVHAAHKDGLLAPIKGDDLYGVKADRLYLHAQNLGFYHPVTKEWVSFMVAPDF
jgi:tRNA pseudouridine32 synthase/23S rRNA pseudouridine746 synthase